MTSLNKELGSGVVQSVSQLLQIMITIPQSVQWELLTVRVSGKLYLNWAMAYTQEDLLGLSTYKGHYILVGQSIFSNSFLTLEECPFLKVPPVGPGVIVQWLKSLPCTCRDPIWVLVLIPATPLPIQFPACGLGKQLRTAQSWDPAPMWETWKSSGLLASDRLSTGCCVHLASETLDRRSSSLSFLLSAYLSFQ